MCGKTVVQAPATPSPSETELQIQKEMLNIMKEQQKPRVLTENEQMLQDYEKMYLEEQIAQFPQNKELNDLQLKYIKEQLAQQDRLGPLQEQLYAEQAKFALANLQEVSKLKELGGISGEITASERSLIDTIENDAISTLRETVNKDRAEVMQAEIASMVDRGVLQGDIGAKAINTINEKALELITQGTRGITADIAGKELAIVQGNKDRALQLQQLVQGGALTAGQALTQQGGNTAGLIGSASSVSQNALAQAIQNMQYGSTLQQNRVGTASGIGAGLYGSMVGERTAAAQRALEASISSAQASAAVKASQWNAAGNIAGMARMAAISSSKQFKENIVSITKDEEIKMFEDISKTPLYTWNYKGEHADGENHTGVITEETPGGIVSEDGLRIKILDYLGYLTASVKVLSERFEKLEERLSHG